MCAQATSQTGTSGLRLLGHKSSHSLHVRSTHRSTANYPRFDYLRPSAIQLCQAL